MNGVGRERCSPNQQQMQAPRHGAAVPKPLSCEGDATRERAGEALLVGATADTPAGAGGARGLRRPTLAPFTTDNAPQYQGWGARHTYSGARQRTTPLHGTSLTQQCA